MAHLSPKKGGFPFKDQHDRTCMVAAGNDKIERGTVLCVNDKGEFEIAADANRRPLYLALQRYDDLQATMAGFFGMGAGSILAKPGTDGKIDNSYGNIPAADGKGPAISGIHLDDGDVWQTDMFDENGDYEIGTAVTVKDGRFAPADASNDDFVVGYVRAVPYSRWANDHEVMKGLMTGGMIRVIDIEVGA